MHARKTILKTQITARVTQEERSRIDAEAEAAGLSTSEYARQLLLSALQGTNPHTRLLLAEICATKAVLGVMQARAAGGEELTDDVVRAITADADSKKFAMADKRLLELKRGIK